MTSWEERQNPRIIPKFLARRPIPGNVRIHLALQTLVSFMEFLCPERRGRSREPGGRGVRVRVNPPQFSRTRRPHWPPRPGLWAPCAGVRALLAFQANETAIENVFNLLKKLIV